MILRLLMPKKVSVVHTQSEVSPKWVEMQYRKEVYCQRIHGDFLCLLPFVLPLEIEVKGRLGRSIKQKSPNPV